MIWNTVSHAKGIVLFQQKLYSLKNHLKLWNKYVFGNIFDRVDEVEQEVIVCEEEFGHSLDNTTLLNLKHSQARLAQALAIEEDFWRQKSGCKWLREGERNTSLFHNLVKRNRK